MSLHHAKHAKSDDAPDGQGALLALALMRSRDAVVATEDLQGIGGAPVGLSPGARLARMDPDHRAAILLAELSEDLPLSADDDGLSGASSASLLCRQRDGTCVPLIRIDRPDLAQLRDAAAMVGHYAELRPDRAPEIQVQTSGLMPFFAAIRPLEPSRNPATLEMLTRALDLTTAAVMRVKLALACPRPGQFSDLIQPMIACPSHPTLPSGHATQAFCLATLLTRLDDPAAPLQARDPLFRLACRIAVNRTVAGVHFPVDSASGAVLGMQVAQYMLARADPGATVRAARFDGRLYHDDGAVRDFHYGVLDGMLGGTDPATTLTGDALAARPAPLWTTLVARARSEWSDRWS
ncbi:phosphatase PAP2 family protein [Paracoccus sp. Ld10]|uniref:phosphatase PAP2 family protein n=1 Tax=Paracoccus sp. Ld10 TaxID=649158 RepID=UPI00386778F7